MKITVYKGGISLAPETSAELLQIKAIREALDEHGTELLPMFNGHNHDEVHIAVKLTKDV